MFKVLEFLLFFVLAFWAFSAYSNKNLPKFQKQNSPVNTPEVEQMVACEHCKIRLPLRESYGFDQRYFCSIEHFNQIDQQGWLGCAKQVRSPNFDVRPEGMEVDTVVIHHISLPEGQFGGTAIEDFFTNQLNPLDDPYFQEIAHLEVSSHFLIKRNGELVQFVSTNDRAWHAGVSRLYERERVNDFSIGIELEGTGEVAFEGSQYQTLAKLLGAIDQRYHPKFFVGHSDVSPDRKTDPGKSFDWKYVSQIAKIPEKKLPFGTDSR